MKYRNEEVRRQDRLLNEENAIELLRSGEFGFLSMIETEGDQIGGYGIPINYVWDEKGIVYFHCAPQGHKLDCLSKNPRVSFCVVGATNVISHQFTTAYESVILRGTACAELSAEERMRALELLVDKYAPNDKVIGKKYAEKSFHRTSIIRLDLLTFSGKTKRVTP